MSQADSGNPFLFLQPYDLKSTFTLKGRADEELALLSLLRWKDIVVVYGKSGIGKTSFVNHTLSERINPVEWIPLRITRLLDINDSFNYRIREALSVSSLYALHGDDNTEVDEGTDCLYEHEEVELTNDPIELVHALYLKWNRPVYLIIDQLEELFLIGTKDEQNKFLRTLRKLMDMHQIKKKLILVLREEHLSYIQDIERILKGVFQEALPMKEIKADAGAEVYNCLLESPRIAAFEEKLRPVKDDIIRQCTDQEKNIFDAQKLQILLFLIWEGVYDPRGTLEGKEAISFVNQLLETVNPLKAYVDKTVNVEICQNARLLKAPIWWILNYAISEAHTKQPVSVSDIYRDMDPHAGNQFRLNQRQVENWCEQLQTEKLFEEILVTKTEIESETIKEKAPEKYYQLRHDSLVAPIESLNPGLPLLFPRKAPVDLRSKNPYRGLNQYDPKDEKKSHRHSIGGTKIQSMKEVARLYGRESIIKEYSEFLLTPKNRCLVVVGDSGTGKSSLVKSGLLPAMLVAGYETKTLQPGADMNRLTKKISEFLHEGKEATKATKKCLYIDQFEECYTFRESTIEDKETFNDFLHFLNSGLENSHDNFKLIISIRHDYAHEFDRKISDWRKYKKLLRYPNQDEIFDIIVGPAFDRGISFIPERLPERIAADAANTSYFLPLLSFTLETLYKYDVAEHEDRHNSNKELSLTEKTYERIGEIVTCLQNEFKKTWSDLDPGLKSLFPELMTRMIVIKDSIPKARPLSIEAIDYEEPSRLDNSIRLLNAFVPRFFRIRKNFVDGERQDCFEPMHDSLLLYCEEIRDIVHSVEQPDSQMFLQPRIESAVREWRKANQDLQNRVQEGQLKGSELVEERNKILTEIIARRYKDLEPLFHLTDSSNPQTNSWLFTNELELVREGRKYAALLQDTEELARAKRLQELEFQHRERQHNEERHKREQQEAIQQLEFQKSRTEWMATVANLRSKRLTRLVFILIWSIVLIGIITYLWYKASRKEDGIRNSFIIQQNESIKRMQKDSVSLVNLGKSNEAKQKETDSVNKILTIRNKDNLILITRLKDNERQLNDALKEKDNISQSLAKQVAWRTDALNKQQMLTDDLKASIAQYEAASREVDSLKNIRINTFAKLNRYSSPVLSYHLAELALKNNPKDPAARSLKEDMDTTDQYFESLIINDANNVTVSRDGQWILAVKKKAHGLVWDEVWVYDYHGNHLVPPIDLNENIQSADFSSDNKTGLVTTPSGIRIFQPGNYDWYSKRNIPNLLFAKFSETGDTIFVITNNKIAIYNRDCIELGSIAFENNGVINNAKMWGNDIVIITPSGIHHVNILRKKTSRQNLPQSFLINGTNRVLAMGKPWLGEHRRLVLFNEKMQEIWSLKLPDKAFNVITSFVANPEGTGAIIQFNQKSEYIQLAQQKQPWNYFDKKSSKEIVVRESYYYLNILNGKLIPFESELYMNLGSQILSANGDAIFDFEAGSILKFSLSKNTVPYKLYSEYLNIGENKRLRQVILMGPKRDLFLSLDANNELKLWRYGRPAELRKQKLLYNVPDAELEKLLSTN